MQVPRIALYSIVILLMADFTLDHVQPAVMLALKEQEYLDAAHTCHEARSNGQQLRDAADQYDPETLFAVSQSATVGLMDCYKMEYLRRSLLAWGVNEHDLNWLDLIAGNKSNVSLPYFVENVIGEK